MGIKYNIMSPICWHVYGLLYRSDGNYKEAKKCYLNAMKRDKTNLHILRDLSLLQIQLRDLPGYLITRKALLALKHSRAESWYSFCMAWELLGHYDEAIDVMNAYEEIIERSEKMKVGDVAPTFETSERKLYIGRLYEEGGRIKEAIEYLKNSEKQIVDKHGLKIILAKLYLKDNDREAAKETYRSLINTNPENRDFHIGLQQAYQLGSGMDELNDEQIAELEKIYEDLRKEFPRCSALKTIPLRFLKPGDNFQRELDNYLQPALRKGIPSLFATLRYFYNISPEKTKIIGDTVQKYYESLKSSERFPGDEGDLLEPPTSILWTILFLAQHYDQIGETQKALDLIDEAIAHTPTVVDIYAFRAEIYKNAGALQKAADAMDECRELDLADRYLNTQTTIYLMHADRVEQADKTIELFTRDADGNCVSLSEMQCVYYEQNAADSYLRTKEYGKSLKKSLSIASHFDDFIEDQFDFHSYCLRKLTLRAYRDLLTMEDRIYSHDNYYNAVCVIVRNYLALYDRPIEEKKNEEERFAGLEGKELTKAKNKWKKEQRKKEAEEQKKKADKERERAKRKKQGGDEDPDGELLEEIEDPLAEAAKFALSLEKWCSDRLDTHLLCFEVFYKKKKYLRSLRSIKKALEMDPSNPIAHNQLIQLALIDASELNEQIRPVFEEERNKITNGASADALNEEYANKYKGYLNRISVARGKITISNENKQAMKEEIFKIDDSATREECVCVLNLVQKLYTQEDVKAFKAKAHEKFPFVSAFE
mmetsp:Transcript_22425/g.38323  ORF Transcript_22425/g.38323 Transcript_22425/m.38323 type:complete len:767 (+) Transcript_22425:46-2346(+)